jgi:pimeloyl-ACP methyl ester carboxylesterase
VSAQQQWLDLSLQDNGFLPGTFIGTGPFDLSTGTYSWDGIKPGLLHYWRVNTMLGPTVWVSSETGPFFTIIPPCPTPSPPTRLLTPTVTPAPPAPPSPTAGPAAARKVILIQGIDSSSACNDDPTNPNSFAARRASVLNALAGTGLGWDDVYGFSYSGHYQDCVGGAQVYDTTALPPGAVTPVYGRLDTCFGVAQAAQRLRLLVSRLAALYPGATFDLVAHSMGGLVASYYVATQDPGFVPRRIHSVVLLDSPVDPGLSVSNPRSVCGAGNQSWPDMSVGSGVIATIADPSRTTVRTQFVCVLATGLIGQVLPGCRVVYTQNYTAPTGGAVGGTIVGILACLLYQPLCLGLPFAPLGGAYLDAAPVHSAVWYDPVALSTIAETVLGP